MNIKYRMLAFLMLLPSLGAAAEIELSDPVKIRDAMAIEKAIDVMTAKVSQCIAQKLAEPAKCFCLYPAEFESFKKTYAIAIKNNPKWVGKLVYFKAPGQSSGHNLNFVGLQTQYEMKCGK